MKNLTETVTQVKIFANPSVITLEDLVNNWLISQSHIISLIEVKQVKFSRQPALMVVYEIGNDKTPQNLFKFQTTAEINEKAA
jgi:hypothetical protein